MNISHFYAMLSRMRYIKFWEDSNANKKACLHAVKAELRKDKF